ncbi:MAG TPA: hypothetical protein VGO90_03590 [Chthoniobacteraceae bacterium]|nr:hypothetical protein [Chthoniobacteraceae bacterium]
MIKGLGLSSGEVSGEDLIARCPSLVGAELLETLKGLIDLGYVVSDTNSFHNMDELRKASFRVNSGYSKELKEALDPRPERSKSKRVRRE